MRGRRDPDALAGASAPLEAPMRLRVSPGRIAAAASVVAILGWATWLGIDKSRRWLHLRPEYAVSFDAITLDPPPPSEIKGGRETILARVRDRAHLDEPIRLLDQDLGEFGRLFAKYSDWVSGVERVRRSYPGRLTVSLSYRVPVAKLELGAGRFNGLSADGVVLPGEEIDPKVAAGLVKIARKDPTWDARPGRYLSQGDRSEVAPEVVSALGLARFLRSHEGHPIATIRVDNGPDRLGVLTRRGERVAWGNGPGSEADGEATAGEKLERLIRWEDANQGKKLDRPKFLYFTRDSIEVGG